MAKQGVFVDEHEQFEFRWEVLSYNEDTCTKTVSWQIVALVNNFPVTEINYNRLVVASYTDDLLVKSYSEMPTFKKTVGAGGTICSGSFQVPDRTTKFSFLYEMYNEPTNYAYYDSVAGTCDIQDAFTLDSGKTKSGVASEESPEAFTLDFLGFQWEITNRDIDKNLVYFSYKLTNTLGYSKDFRNVTASVEIRQEDGTLYKTIDLVSGLNVNGVAGGGTIKSGSFYVEGYVDDTRANICYLDAYATAATSSSNDMIIHCMRWKYRNIHHPSNVSTTSCIIGQYPPFVFTKKHDEAISTLTYTFGSLSGTIVENFSGTNYREWQVPTEFYYQMPNSRQMACTLTCTTTLRGEELGSSTSTFLVLVNEDECKPTINSFTVSDSNSRAVAATGSSDIFVQNASIASYTVDAVGTYGATIESIKVYNDDMERSIYAYATGATGTIQPISYYIDFHSSYDYPVTAFLAVVTDSRGITRNYILYKQAIEYKIPTLKIKIGNLNGTGEMYISANGYYDLIKFGTSSNAATNVVTLQYRLKTQNGEYTSWYTMDLASDATGYYEASKQITGLDYTQKYVIQIRAIDSVYEVLSEELQVVSMPIFDWSSEDFNFNVQVTAPQINIPNKMLYVDNNPIDFSSLMTGEQELATYENGTWTPVVPNFTTNQSYGAFIRIGNMVVINWYVRGNAVEDAAGYVLIDVDSLPYPPNSYVAWQAGGGSIQGVTIPTDQAFCGWVLTSSGLYARTASVGYKAGSNNGYCTWYYNVTNTVYMSGTLMYIADV